LPVVAPDGALAGIVTEGDLLRHAELVSEDQNGFRSTRAILALAFRAGCAVRARSVARSRPE
jgi:hypothetical protein